MEGAGSGHSLSGNGGRRLELQGKLRRSVMEPVDGGEC